ncbi:hypothetical protein PUATCC27989T_00430 [Phytobacter ursingii]|nr:hypothetical protein PUATCC27989T_00430 [Phytobacter ursingii]
MKLKELLVKELPGRGGWPEGAHYAAQDDDGSIHTFERAPEIDCGEWIDADESSPAFVSKIGCFNLASDQHEAIITRSEYEAALAAAQKIEWDGEGLPPIGLNIIVTPHNDCWGFDSVDDFTGKVLAYDDDEFWFKLSNGVKITSRIDKVDFRPIRSEADKKRKETIDLMDKRFKEVLAAGSTEAMAIFATVYDTITAGKIPGVRIE